MRKRRKLALLIVMLAMAVGAVVWTAYRHHAAQASTGQFDSWPSGPSDQPPPKGFSYGEADTNQPPANHDQVVEAATRYLISRVGEENFPKLYERMPQRDAFSSLPESAFDFVAYRFKPTYLYRAHLPEPDSEAGYIQVNRTNLKEIYGPTPRCVTDPGQCQFNVTAEQAKSIARKHGLNGELSVDLSGFEGGYYRLGVRSCDDGKTLVLDYSNGNIIKTVKGCEPVYF